MSESMTADKPARSSQHATLLKAAADRAHDGMFIFDADTGIILEINRRVEKNLGYNRERLIGEHVTEIMASENPAEKWSRIEKRSRETGPIQIEMKHQRKDGSVLPVEIDAEFISDETGDYIIATTRDISGRRQTQREMERLKLVAERTDNGILITDEWGTVEWVNQSFADMTGFRFDGVCREEMASIFGKMATDSSSVEEDVRTALENGEGLESEYKVQSPDGESFWMSVLLEPIRAEDGTPDNFMMLALDVTARKETERQLRSAQKMEALGRMSGSIAHDFNHYLTLMRSYAQFVRDEISEEDDIYSDIAQLIEASHKAEDLTDKLRSFARQEDASNTEQFSVDERLRDLEEMLTNTLASRTHLALNLDAGDGDIEINPTEFEQVLMNLTVNADEAMPEGETVEITTRSMPEAPRREPLESGDYIEIQVADSGEGIDSDHLDKLFEPSFTTKENGNGLGLSTTYSIIEDAGGTIEVDSEIDVGTTFFIYLPKAD